MKLSQIAAFSCLLASCIGGVALDQPGGLKEIVSGVWFRESAGGCNNIVIEMSDHLVIVDANYPGPALDLVREVHSRWTTLKTTV